MASVHRRKGSKYWYASFRIPVEVDPSTGRAKRSRQILRCTKKTDRGEALRVAAKIEEAEKIAAGAGDETSRRILGVLSRATDYASKGLLSETLARQFLEEIYLVSNETSLEHHSMRSWGTEWLEGKSRTVKPSTLRLYDLAVRKFCEWLGEKADGRVELVTTSELESFRNQLHDEGRSAKMANQYLKSLSGCLRAAVDRGILLKNPCDPISPLPQADSVRRKPFTLEEVKRLLQAADSDWQAAITIGLYTGLRLRDVTELRWSSVEFDSGLLQVEPKKQLRKLANKKTLQIPMHPSVREHLKRLHSERSDPNQVFPNLARKKTGGRYGLSFYFNRIMEEAKVDPEYARTRKEGQKGRAVPLKGFHSLRHTFVSLLAEQEVARELRKSLTGHLDDESHDIYTHIGTEKMKLAVNKIPVLDE